MSRTVSLRQSRRHSRVFRNRWDTPRSSPTRHRSSPQRNACNLRREYSGCSRLESSNQRDTPRRRCFRPVCSPRRMSRKPSVRYSGRRRRVSCIQWDTPRTCSTRPRARSPRRSSGAIALVDAPRRRRRRAWRSRRQGRAATRGARDGSISPARTRWAPPPAAPPRVPPPRRRRLVRRRAWGWTTVGVSAIFTQARRGRRKRERGRGLRRGRRGRGSLTYAGARDVACPRVRHVGSGGAARGRAPSSPAGPLRSPTGAQRPLRVGQFGDPARTRDAPGAAARPRPRRTAPAFASRVQASPRRLAAAAMRARACVDAQPSREPVTKVVHSLT